MDFNEIMTKRYATKKFDSKIISKDDVTKLKEYIRFSPSSFNIQPWKIKIVADDEGKQKLLPATFNQEQITTCSHLFVLCANTNLIEVINKIKKQMIDNGAPVEKILGYADTMIGYVNSLNDEQKLHFAQLQVYIVLTNLMNGATSLGLDSCPMGGFDAKQYSEILNLKDNIIPTVICPVGYGIDTPKPKLRFENKDIFF
jgi:nitroreductase / dihydropteridine reductase